MRPAKHGAAPDLVFGPLPPDYQEACGVLWTNLSSVAADCRSIAVTSACRGEGKSTVAVRLAHAMGASGRRVLLMDCDLRSPALSRMLRIQPEASRGLVPVLTGELRQVDIIRHVPLGLDLLPAGPVPKDAGALLRAGAFPGILKTLLRSYDCIICDTPPVLEAADAAILGRSCGGILLVVRQDRTERDQVRQAKRQLELAGGTILGTVLNRFDTGKLRL